MSILSPDRPHSIRMVIQNALEYRSKMPSVDRTSCQGDQFAHLLDSGLVVLKVVP
jgi:hypothetical protein